MRISALAVLVCAALVAGCSDPCQELGDRLCECRPAGTTKASCTDGVRTELERLHPGGGDKGRCEKYLDTCSAPSGHELCDWIEGRCGKAACGMSEEQIAELQQKPLDPATPECQASPSSEACAKICPGATPSSSSSSSSSGGGSSSSSSSSGGGSSSSSSSSSSGG